MATKTKKKGAFASFIEGKVELRTILTLAVLVILIALFTALTGGSFVTNRNISNLLRQTSIWAIMGLTMCWLIVTMGIVSVLWNIWYRLIKPTPSSASPTFAQSLILTYL